MLHIVSKPGSASPGNAAHQTADAVRTPPSKAGDEFGLFIAVLVWAPIGALCWFVLAWCAL